ncbi:MAG: hypothetical protein ACRDKS_11445 [Actinomycetota bacterium]
MRRSRPKARVALIIATLALAVSGFASTGAQASCIINPISGGCLNVCPPIFDKLGLYCTY